MSYAKRIIAVGSGIIAFILLIYCIAYHSTANEYCVYSISASEIRGGEITCDSNSLGDVIDQYWLFYSGKHRVSGKDCNRRARVTKEKYSKEMYGE